MSNEEIVLMIQNGENEKENMQQLWQQNRGYIQTIIRKYEPYAEEDDLEQEAYLGLYKAVHHYDRNQNVLFLTYAGYWIQQEISRYVKSNTVVRLPEYFYSRVSEYERIVQDYKYKHGRIPSDRELCKIMGIGKSSVENLKRNMHMKNIRSMDAQITDEDDGTTLHDLVPSNGNPYEIVVDKVQQEELAAVLWDLVDKLPGKSPNVIRRRFKDNLTLREISEQDGVTIEATRQWESKGLRELRKPSRSRQLRPFISDERMYSIGLQGNGVGSFNRTWTSSTERAVLWKEEKEMMQI